MKTPQKTTKPATDLVALSRTGTDLDALDAGLAEARGRIEVATRDRDAAEASYREQILDASPAELEKIQAAKARAVVELDRAEALTAALTRRIASVRDDRERDARRAQHADPLALVQLGLADAHKVVDLFVGFGLAAEGVAAASKTSSKTSSETSNGDPVTSQT